MLVTRVKQFLNHPLAKNTFALYLVQFSRYLLPLVTVPYLARVLGPDSWGKVIFVQTFSTWLAIILDYGFNLSATREIARAQHDKEKIAEIVSGVMGAKGVLIVFAFVVSLVLFFAIPNLRQEPGLWVIGWFLAVFAGSLPLWYFQGIEQMQKVAVLDIGSRLFSTACVFVFVRGQAYGWLYLLILTMASFMSAIVALVWMYQTLSFKIPPLSQVVCTLREGFSMFLFQSAVSLYTTANIFLLGLFIPASQLAFYGSADKINKIVLSFTQPMSQVLFPRVNVLIWEAPKKAARVVRYCLALMAFMGIMMALILFMYASFTIKLLFGEQYSETVSLLRILALTIPFIALSSVLGIQWMLPLQLDKTFNTIIIGAGITNVLLALFIVPHYGAVGMAWLLVFSESLVFSAMIFNLLIRKLDPFNYVPQSKSIGVE
jgi:PST family polysaccharide transporter